MTFEEKADLILKAVAEEFNVSKFTDLTFGWGPLCFYFSMLLIT